MMRPDTRRFRRIMEELRYLHRAGQEAQRLGMLEELAALSDVTDLAGLLDDAEADSEDGGDRVRLRFLV